MNQKEFTRFYLSYLVFNIGGWIYFGHLMYYTYNITTQTCNSNSKELIDIIKTLFGISMILTSMNIIVASSGAIKNEEYDTIISHMNCILISTIIFLSASGLCSFALFCITSGMTDIRCSNTDYELGLKLAVYGTLWIALLQLLFIVLTIMCFWYKIMIESKLHHFCINFYNHIFNLFKKYTQRRIGIESSSTTNHISIPMPVSTFKESKIICSVCYDNSVTLLLEPCNHICICNICYESLVTKECPICKTKIDVTRKVFFASPSCSN